MFDDNKIAEIIRVNHAGERGAKVIYAGQMLALKLKGDKETHKLIEEMQAQEIAHFEYFDNKVKQHHIRPTLMQPVWEVGGFALGFLTALIDKKSAMVCTTAVEEVIDEHYQEQITDLQKICEAEEVQKNSQMQLTDLQDLRQNIQQFRDDEIHHRDIGYEHNARDFIAYKPLSTFIKFTTKLAIEVSKRV